jgi:hypothetical protein
VPTLRQRIIAVFNIAIRVLSLTFNIRIYIKRKYGYFYTLLGILDWCAIYLYRTVEIGLALFFCLSQSLYWSPSNSNVFLLRYFNMLTLFTYSVSLFRIEIPTVLYLFHLHLLLFELCSSRLLILYLHSANRIFL